MARYLATRVLSIVPVLAVVAVVGFALLRLMPGDPATAMLPFNATAAQVAALRQQLGLDRPMVVQFSRYCQRLLEGNLGSSLFFRQPVTTIIATRAESTLLLAALSGALAVAVAVPAGVWAAARRGTWIDQTLQAASLTVVSIPAFWFGLILILVFAVRYHWFPVTGYVRLAQAPAETLRFLTLPVIALGLSNAAAISRMARAGMLEVLSQDYIRTALAKGLGRRATLFTHALRNAMPPLLATIGLTVSSLLGGAAVIEIVFTIPGVGSMMVDSIGRRDYPMIQALLILFALANMIVNLGVDLMYALLNPRIRYV